MIHHLLLVVILAVYLVTIGFALRIVGGNEISITNVPSTVSLQRNGRHICGASILNNRTLLTAAHCVKSFSINSLSIRAGSNFHANGGIMRSVSRVKVHQQFNEMTMNYDVALVYLSSTLSFSPAISPITIITSKDSIRANTDATISGWGSVIQEGGASDKLLGATIKMIKRSKCRKIYGKQLKSVMFCAGLLTGAKDACQGDSGGGLIIDGKVAGIVSWGIGCAQRNFPGVYTWVAKIASWITSNMDEN